MFVAFISVMLVSQTFADVMKMVDSAWLDRFVPREYKKLNPDNDKEVDVSKSNNYGYSDQSMKDLNEVGGLVGGGDSELLAILRPYYSVVDMSANGNKQGMGSYLHVLPDSSEGDEPIYTLGGSFFGGLEPAGAKIGYLTRPFG